MTSANVCRLEKTETAAVGCAVEQFSGKGRGR